jgi:hypothetical protein
MRQLLKFLLVAAACGILLGCAHPINMKPDLAKLQDNGVKPIDKKVGYYISEANLALEVTTPGGGGDKVRYFPYRDIEPGIYKALSSVFGSVSKIKNPKDAEELRNSNIALLISPEVSTTSSSPSPFTWPPTLFTVTLVSAITGEQGQTLRKISVTGNGKAEFDEFKSNFSLAAVRAADDALAKLVKALSEVPELRANATAVQMTAIAATPAAVNASNVTNGSARAALNGEWAGRLNCGVYIGSGTVSDQRKAPFQSPITMTVSDDGKAALLRNGQAFSEISNGILDSASSLTLDGKGRMNSENEGWLSKYSGQFSIKNGKSSFSGIAQTLTMRNVATRDCTFEMAKR